MIELKSVQTEVISKRLQGNRIIFNVEMRDLNGTLLYIFPGVYDIGTEDCECHYRPQISGVTGSRDYKGKKGVCENYPAGNCDVLCKEILDLAKSKKQKER